MAFCGLYVGILTSPLDQITKNREFARKGKCRFVIYQLEEMTYPLQVINDGLA